MGLSSTFDTQSATVKRGIYVCKNPLLKPPFSCFRNASAFSRGWCAVALHCLSVPCDAQRRGRNKHLFAMKILQIPRMGGTPGIENTANSWIWGPPCTEDIVNSRMWGAPNSLKSGVFQEWKKLTRSSLNGFLTGPFLLIKMGVLQAVFSS